MHDRRLAARAGELKPSAVRELLKHSKLPGVISLGGGIPAPELFDTEGLELAVQKVMSERFNDAFQYGLTEGYPPLRQAVSEICHSRGVACSAAQVYITSGSQQSLDIVARTLLDPGDTIVVERPTYLAALQVFQLAQANILSVDTDDDGMLVEQLADLLETTRVKAVYLVPTFGNPGGKTLSEARRRRLVELAKKYDFVILEDDPYGEISFTDAVRRPLYQHAVELGCEDQVVYTSTFSKILAPGMRIGWIVMPDWLAQQTVIVKQAADLHTNMLSQVITAEYLSLNRLDNQIALIREDYRKKCVALADALESRLGEHLEFSRPQGGMFLWARFRYPFDTMEWMKKTLENGVVYVPGEAFYHDKPDTRTLRLSYSTVSEAGLLTAVERLAASLLCCAPLFGGAQPCVTLTSSAGSIRFGDPVIEPDQHQRCEKSQRKGSNKQPHRRPSRVNYFADSTGERSLRSAMEILVPAEWLAREKKSSASISKLRIISLYFPPLINALASLTLLAIMTGISFISF